ncbi:EI24 domain-containing protein [Streptomyces sp. NPDC002574]|uniref:EI24 domain-containing protein n=1 Tax=Streptomyces sp. NPDC002574 TaxID=3364652 RepID=UPI0036BAB98D
MGDLATGIRHFVDGQRWVVRHGRWFGFGLLPALITLVGYLAALVVLAFWADDATAWATPFADDWGSPWQGLFRGLLTVVVFGGGLVLAVISFTAVTLLVGQPFYESLAERVDDTEGGAPDSPDVPLWRELLRSAWDSLRVLVRVTVWTVALFAAGFIPVVGQTVVPVIGFCVSGFFLALELSGVAFQRREVPLRERLRMLRGRMMLSLGFGVPLVLCFLVPVVAVFLMPGAVAGATLLVRDLLPPQADDRPAEAGPEAAPGSAPRPLDLRKP